MRALLTVLLMVALGAGGCASKRTSDRDLAFVGPDEAATLVRPRRDLLRLGRAVSGVWVDPRTAAEYEKMHIPGAVHLPYERARAEHARLDRDAPVVVYGTEYDSTLARAMAKTLLELGFSDVRILRGGLRGWEASGKPTESGATASGP